MGFKLIKVSGKILFWGMFFLLFGCKEKKGIDGLITLSIDGKASEKADFDEFSEDLEVIRLETTSECLIGNVDKVIVQDSLIFIQDEMKAKAIFCFDIRGKFKYKVGTVGKGPGEYIFPEDFVVDDNGVSIFDNGRGFKKINYDLKGRFINESPTIVKTMNVRKFSDDTLFIRPVVWSPHDIEDGYNLIITNGDASKIYAQYLKGLKRIEDISFPDLFWKYGAHMLYTYGYNDTIYMYKEGRLNPYMFINFLHKKLPEDILKQADLKMASSEFRNPKKTMQVGYMAWLKIMSLSR